jgi:hypothetical protein
LPVAKTLLTARMLFSRSDGPSPVFVVLSGQGFGHSFPTCPSGFRFPKSCPERKTNSRLTHKDLRARARNEARQAKRGAFGQMCAPLDIRPFWGPFIYGGREDNLYDSRCPSRRAPPRPHAPAQKPHRWPPGGAFDSVVGGREGPLPMELYLLHPAFCLRYQKPPPPVLLCPSCTRSKASAPAPSPWFLGLAGNGDRAGQLAACQSCGFRRVQQFTASRLGCLPLQGLGKDSRRALYEIDNTIDAPITKYPHFCASKPENYPLKAAMKSR